MPDDFRPAPPLPSQISNAYARGHLSGGITEPEQPLIVLGDEGSGMDDVMELVFIGASITDLGGNIAQVEIDFNLDVTSNAGNAFSATSIHFVDVHSVFEDGNFAAVVQVFPTGGASQSFLIRDSNGTIRWSNNPGAGTFVQGWVNGVLTFIATTTC